MPSTTTPSEAAAFARAAIDALALTEDLLAGQPVETARSDRLRFPFAELWAYATDPACRPAPDLVRACAEGGPVASDFGRRRN